MSDLSDQIANDALKPQAVTVDGVSTTYRSTKDQIEADKHTAANAATASPAQALKGMILQIVPPGGSS